MRGQVGALPPVPGVGQMTAEDLICFETTVRKMFEDGHIKAPVHLSGGNERVLIDIFKDIKREDYVFSTHRNHYHYLLHVGDAPALFHEIMGWPTGVCKGHSRSMHTIDRAHNFFSSGIVAGLVAVACGVALALKIKKSKRKVWCFVGDGATDGGWLFEAIHYAQAQELPVTFVIEDNDRSVATSIKERWGEGTCWLNRMNRVLYYKYKPTYPHVGCGKWVTF